MDAKTTTLFGSRSLPVKFNDGSDGDITVHQLQMDQWPAALKLMADEIALNALACRMDLAEFKRLAPASYHDVHKAVREVNAEGFFIYADRQAEMNAQNLRMLPTEMVEKIISSRLSVVLPPAAR